MNFSFLKNLIEVVEKYRVKNQKKLMVYGVFVLISTVFWLLSTLSENYTTTVNFPVRFSHLPEKSVLVNELPEKIQLKVEAHGFTLLRYKISRSLVPININVKNFSLLRVPDHPTKYFLLSRYTQQKVANQLKDDINVIEIQPDSFIFDFTKIVERKIAVKPVVDYNLQRQFLLKKIKCTPDSIIVSGPQSIMDTLRFIETRTHKLGKLDRSIKRNMQLKNSKQLKTEFKRVTVELEIEKFTQTSFQLPVEIINAPEEFNIKLFPDEVNVSFMVAISDYEKVKPYHFRLIANYEKASNNLLMNNHKLKVDLKKFPSFVNSINIYPAQLDYLLEKK